MPAGWTYVGDGIVFNSWWTGGASEKLSFSDIGYGSPLDAYAMYLTKPQGKKGKGRGKRTPLGGIVSGVAGDSLFNHITIEGFSDDRTQQIKAELGKMFGQPCADAFHAAGLKSPDEAIMRSGLQIRDSEYLKNNTAAQLGLKEGDRLNYIEQFRGNNGAQGGTFVAADTLNGHAQMYLKYSAWGGEALWDGKVSFNEVIRHEMMHVAGQPNVPPSWSQWLNWRNRHDLGGFKDYNKILAACQ